MKNRPSVSLNRLSCCYRHTHSLAFRQEDPGHSPLRYCFERVQNWTVPATLKALFDNVFVFL
jgi:hypothetical protein